LTLLATVVVGGHDASLDGDGLDSIPGRRTEVEVDHGNVVTDLAKLVQGFLVEEV